MIEIRLYADLLPRAVVEVVHERAVPYLVVLPSDDAIAEALVSFRNRLRGLVAG